MNSSTPEQAITAYARAGWPVCTPLPSGSKCPPTKGITGRAISIEERQAAAGTAWQKAPDNANVGLVLVAETTEFDVLALDVDHYGEKHGADELEALEAELGSLELESVPRSTRRGVDSRAAHFFFRVPHGLHWAGAACAGVDVIQPGHRYAVVWPSSVDGQTYTWFCGNDEIGIPAPDSLPWLPNAWVERLSQGPASERAARGEVAGYDDAVGWLKSRTRSGVAQPLAVNWANSSRHDAMNAAVLDEIGGSVHRGRPGVLATLDEIEREFVSALDATGERWRAFEFQDSVTSAVALVKGEIESGKRQNTNWRELEERLGPLEELACPSVIATQPQTPTYAAAPGSHGLIDLAPYVNGEVEPITPTVGRRTDGAALLYPGVIHSIHGYSGSGKSWVGLFLAAQVIQDGGDVLWIDYEQNERVIVQRLQTLGLSNSEIIDRFGYMRPEMFPHPDSDAADEFYGVLKTHRYTLAVIDSVGQSLSVAGLESNSNDDASLWHRLIPVPLAKAGAAVLQIDHVGKNTGDKSHAIGAQSKRGNVEVAFGAETTKAALRPGHTGKLEIIVYKDRHGELMAAGEQRGSGYHLATFVMQADDTCEFVPPSPPLSSTPETAAAKPGVLDGHSGLLEADPRHTATVAQINAAIALVLCERDGKDGVSLKAVRNGWQEFAPQRWHKDRAAIMAASTAQKHRGLKRIRGQRYRAQSESDTGVKHADVQAAKRLAEMVQSSE